jgi:hypothetical protein
MCYVEVPDDWQTVEPNPADVRLTKIELTKDTRNYLEGTFHTDVAKLEAKLFEDWFPDITLEHMADTIAELDGDDGLERWCAKPNFRTVDLAPTVLKQMETFFADELADIIKMAGEPDPNTPPASE